MAIDDPLEQIRKITSEDGGDDPYLGAILRHAASFHPLIGVAAAFKGVLDGQKRWNRIKESLVAICDELGRMQDHWPPNLENALGSDCFKRAMSALVEESSRATTEDYARLLARVAARGCFPDGKNKHRQQDLASYIHDLARRGEDDVQMLKLLKEANREAIRRHQT